MKSLFPLRCPPHGSEMLIVNRISSHGHECRFSVRFSSRGHEHVHVSISFFITNTKKVRRPLGMNRSSSSRPRVCCRMCWICVGPCWIPPLLSPSPSRESRGVGHADTENKQRGQNPLCGARRANHHEVFLQIYTLGLALRQTLPSECCAKKHGR